MSKKVIVMGASLNPSRFANLAVNKLQQKGFEVLAFGKKSGYIGQVKVSDTLPNDNDIYAIVMYMNAQNQKPFEDYIVNTHPHFVFFNPGSYNAELIQKLEARKIKVIQDCTLIALNRDDF